ncbi:hypothetical protein [Pontibacter litorisediminis]|uniref:hypothetical protein n=1 Tax=Pontibacter litorisediminis TaxID=1846260 RepID=UPI0023EDA4C9|nr:hypothetical protein [Pontibacter litorisediminis]
MNKLLLLTLFILLSLSVHAQVLFEQGYFVDNNGQRIDCLIRNTDKARNPTSFEYKLTENSVPEVATIDAVKEFEVLNTPHKYQRFTVKIDRSGSKGNDLSNNREPQFEEEQLFLRASLIGEASLYAYYDRNGLERFFYKTTSTAMQQLVYKKFMLNGNKIGVNNTYRQQLWTNLECSGLTEKDFSNIEYDESDLVKLFKKYNECIGANYIDNTAKKEKGKTAFTLKAGLNSSILQVDQVVVFSQSSGPATLRNVKHYTTTSNRNISPQIGLEAEYVFPFNKSKWSVFAELTLHFVKFRTDLTVYSSRSAPSNPGGSGAYDGNTTVNYSHVVLPVGVRHYFFLNESSKLFINGTAGLNFLLTPNKAFDSEDNKLNTAFDHKVSTFLPSFTAGLGYKRNNKFSIEANYNLGKVMLENDQWETKLTKSLSLVLGYTLGK